MFANRFVEICSMMHDIIRNYPRHLDDPFLTDGWPGDGDIWHAGDDMTFVAFYLDRLGSEGSNIINTDFHRSYDTSCMPIPWAALPAMLNIFKSKFQDENAHNEERCKKITTAIPYEIYYDDFGEDDDLSVSIMNAEDYNRLMFMKDDSMKRYLEYQKKGNDIVRLSIGLYNHGLEKFIDDIKDVDDMIVRGREILRDNYLPMIIQIGDDDEGEISICMWFAKEFQSPMF